MNFVAVAIVSAIVLGLKKEPSFDWFKSHSPLFKSQYLDHQKWILLKMGRTRKIGVVALLESLRFDNEINQNQQLLVYFCSWTIVLRF